MGPGQSQDTDDALMPHPKISQIQISRRTKLDTEHFRSQQGQGIQRLRLLQKVDWKSNGHGLCTGYLSHQVKKKKLLL